MVSGAVGIQPDFNRSGASYPVQYRRGRVVQKQIRPDFKHNHFHRYAHHTVEGFLNLEKKACVKSLDL